MPTYGVGRIPRELTATEGFASNSRRPLQRKDLLEAQTIVLSGDGTIRIKRGFLITNFLTANFNYARCYEHSNLNTSE